MLHHILLLQASKMRFHFWAIEVARQENARLRGPGAEEEAAGDCQGGLLQAASRVGVVHPGVTKLPNLKGALHSFLV